MFGAEPAGDDSPAGELKEKGWLLAHESDGASLFVGQVGSFPKLGVTASFFEPSDALRAIDRVRVKNVVVADPQLERKVGADRYQAVEIFVIANRPRSTTKDNQGKCQDWNGPWESGEAVGAQSRPGKY